MIVKTNLKQLLADREMSIRQLSADTGIHFETVRKLVNNEMQKYPRDVLAKVCDHLDIELKELLYIDTDIEE